MKPLITALLLAGGAAAVFFLLRDFDDRQAVPNAAPTASMPEVSAPSGSHPQTAAPAAAESAAPTVPPHDATTPDQIPTPADESVASAPAITRQDLERAGEDVETGNALLNDLVRVIPDWLLPALKNIVEDETQSPTWRNYAIQHLTAHYELHADDEALQIILAATRLSEPEVLEVAIFSLARLSRDTNKVSLHTHATTAIESGLLPGAHPLVRDAAVRSIGEIEDNSRTAFLLTLAADPAENTQVRLAAIDVLGAWRAITALPVLRDIAASKDIAVLIDASRRSLNRIEPEQTR